MWLTRPCGFRPGSRGGRDHGDLADLAVQEIRGMNAVKQLRPSSPDRSLVGDIDV
jgi:hypothetical protein